jgi:uncharacterized repeat protein (TIGR03803 family)
LYGLTTAGGAYNLGVLYEYNPVNNVLTKKIDLTGIANGNNPFYNTLVAYNNKLYGMITNGGTNNKGILFEYDPSINSFINKINFDGTATGASPFGNLTVNDSKLYGMTMYGGINNKGVLFEYDPLNGTIVKKIDFDGTNGRNPMGGLCSSNHKLIGLTSQGGTKDVGVIFEYDPLTNNYIKRLDFDSTNGAYPFSTYMVAYNPLDITSIAEPSGYSENSVIYPNPSNGEFTIRTDGNIESVVITNVLGQKEKFNSNPIHSHFKGLVIVEIKTDKGILIKKAELK